MLQRIPNFVLVLTLTFAISASAAAQHIFKGEVVDVLDGKTVVLQLPAGKINVELQFIDVPGNGAKMQDLVREHLQSLVMGKVVEYHPRNILRDRTIGKLTVNNVDVSQQMLRDGAAWHMPARLSGQDENDFKTYESTESVAKSEKRGIWGVPDLRPSWEQAYSNSSSPMAGQAGSSSARASATKRHGYWGDKNPRLANIGALVNGYNAQSRTGYLSTSLLKGKKLDGSKFDGEFGLDITYLYKEGDGRIGRKGVFVATLVFESDKIQFLKNNGMVAVIGDKKVNLGPPKRFVKKDGGVDREVMQYSISRDTLEKLINSDAAYLKLGSSHVFYLIDVRYLVYNMLELAG